MCPLFFVIMSKKDFILFLAACHLLRLRRIKYFLEIGTKCFWFDRQHVRRGQTSIIMLCETFQEHFSLAHSPFLTRVTYEILCHNAFTMS